MSMHVDDLVNLYTVRRYGAIGGGFIDMNFVLARSGMAAVEKVTDRDVVSVKNRKGWYEISPDSKQPVFAQVTRPPGFFR